MENRVLALRGKGLRNEKTVDKTACFSGVIHRKKAGKTENGPFTGFSLWSSQPTVEEFYSLLLIASVISRMLLSMPEF